MKPNKFFGCILFFAAIVFISPAYAQSDKEKDKAKEKAKEKVKEEKEVITVRGNRLHGDQDIITVRGYPVKDYGEIIIKRKSSENDVKLDIVLKANGELIVDNKPFENFSSKDVSIILRNPTVISMNRTGLTNGVRVVPGSSVRMQRTGYLGISMLDDAKGVKVLSVVENSPAAQAGLKKDDIITHIDDKKTDNSQLLTEIIRTKPADAEVEIKFLRQNKQESVKVKLSSNPNSLMAFDDGLTKSFFNEVELFNDFKPGFQFYSVNSTPKLGIQAQDTEDENGVKVLKIEEESIAAGSGLKLNDIITSFNEQPIKNVDQLIVLSKTIAGKSNIPVEVLRNGKKESLTIKIPKKLKTASF